MSQLRTRARAASTLLACAVLTAGLALTAACGGESKPASTPATGAAAQPAAAKPAAGEAPKATGEAPKAAAAEAPATQPTPVEAAGTAAATAAKAADAPPADAKPADVKAVDPKVADAGPKPVDPHAGHDHAKDVVPPGEAGSDVVDPNSKAKLVYEFGSDTKAFGKVMQGDVLNHTFQLSSGGEEDLIVKQVKPTCGCTVAQVRAAGADGVMGPYTYGTPLPPGRKIEVTATLHTQNKRGHAGSRINIMSNDPRGQTQLGLEADVEPFFQITPNMINFQQLSSKDSKTEKLAVSTTKGERVKLTAAIVNVPQGLKVELNPLDADADGKATRWEMVATAGPGLVEGNLAYSVPLKSDQPIPGAEKLPDGSTPTYDASATVMGRVTGMISFSPAFVSFGLIRPGQVVSKSVRVECHDPEFKLGEPKITIQGREGPDWEYAKYFSSVARPVAGANAIEIEVRLDGMPETLNGSFAGVLNIQPGHPEKPEIKLPITGVCRGGAVGSTSTGLQGGSATKPN